MGMNYQGQIQNGPTPGTQAPPTVPPAPGSDPGGPSTGGVPLDQTMAKWRQGVFTPPPPAGSMSSPSSPAPGTGGRVSGPPPAGSPQSHPAPSAPGAPMGAPAPPGTPGMVPGTGVPGAAMLPAMPQPHEVDQLAPGSYETPLGTLVKGPDGTSKVILNQMGQEQYRKRFGEAVQAFGDHPFSSDPNAPPPPVTPGALSFNPFSPQGWSDAAPPPPTGAV